MTEPPTPDASKAAWRRWALAVRSTASSSRNGRLVAAAIRSWEPYRAARHVLAYLPFRDEVDVSVLYDDPDRIFYITRTWEDPRGLTVHRLVPEALETHPFGYRQPPPAVEPVAPEMMELALVPGLAFDRAGRRLGYGMGYFDRLLGRLDPAAPLLGVTLEALLVARLPTDAWDVPMTHLGTERGVREADRAGASRSW